MRTHQLASSEAAQEGNPSEEPSHKNRAPGRSFHSDLDTEVDPETDRRVPTLATTTTHPTADTTIKPGCLRG